MTRVSKTSVANSLDLNKTETILAVDNYIKTGTWPDGFLKKSKLVFTPSAHLEILEKVARYFLEKETREISAMVSMTKEDHDGAFGGQNLAVSQGTQRLYHGLRRTIDGFKYNFDISHLEVLGILSVLVQEISENCEYLLDVSENILLDDEEDDDEEVSS